MKNKTAKILLLSFILTALFCGCSAEAWHPGDTATTVSVSRVSLNKASMNLTVGYSETLTATIAPNNATNKGVTWRSSNTSAATVSSGGLVRGVAAGSATVTVTTNDGNKTATCAVTVTSGSSNVPVTGVSLNKTTMNLTVGISETLTATITPSNATNKALTWRSSNASTATVSSSGLVTAVAAGSATVTVTTSDGNKTATCAVTVISGSGSKTINLGYFTIDNHDSQKGWCTDGTDGISTSLNIDDLIAAKFLVLELTAKPTGGLDMIWQGDVWQGGVDWTWNQQDGILSNTGEPDAQLGAAIMQGAGKVILRIELSKALKNYNAFILNTKAKIFIAYYSPDIDALGITRAYLEL